MKTIRILIADDHKLMRMGLKSLMVGNDDLVCVGEVEDGEEAVAEAKRLKPDVILMDLMMPNLTGSAATRVIRESLPNTRVIILTSYGTSKEMSDAITNGAAGALMKDTAANDLVKAIRTIAAGERIIPERLQRQADEDNVAPNLTDRHLEILTSIAQGHSNADIAKRFGVSEITIKKNLSQIFERLGVANRSEAVALALRKQLLKS